MAVQMFSSRVISSLLALTSAAAPLTTLSLHCYAHRRIVMKKGGVLMLIRLSVSACVLELDKPAFSPGNEKWAITECAVPRCVIVCGLSRWLDGSRSRRVQSAVTFGLCPTLSHTSTRLTDLLHNRQSAYGRVGTPEISW